VFGPVRSNSVPRQRWATGHTFRNNQFRKQRLALGSGRSRSDPLQTWPLRSGVGPNSAEPIRSQWARHATASSQVTAHAHRRAPQVPGVPPRAPVAEQRQALQPASQPSAQICHHPTSRSGSRAGVQASPLEFRPPHSRSCGVRPQLHLQNSLGLEASSLADALQASARAAPVDGMDPCRNDASTAWPCWPERRPDEMASRAVSRSASFGCFAHGLLPGGSRQKERWPTPPPDGGSASAGCPLSPPQPKLPAANAGGQALDKRCSRPSAANPA